ncbi:MAG: hypothetical protein ACRDFQ_09630 [Anaerolineales bacterium]
MKLGKIHLGLLTAIAILLLAAAIPAMAAPRIHTIQAMVENRTGETVELTLNGPGPAQLYTVGSGQSLQVELEPGLYIYRYFACGQNKYGLTTFDDGSLALVLGKCGEGANSNIVIDNHTGDAFIVTLTGTGGLYGYWVPEGGITISIPAGRYQVTTTACLAPEEASIKASPAKYNDPLIWTWTCDAVTLFESVE